MAALQLGIVQDYVPRYRFPFFEGLVDRLSDAGVRCVVIAGQPTGSLAGRGDATETASWLRQAAPHELVVGRNGPRVYGYGTSRHWRDCDGVIHLLRGTAIDLHLELLTKKRSGRRVGVWGHIGRTIGPPNPVDTMLERWQMRHSDHIFGYTQQCAEAALAEGISAEKVTPVMNSIDVSALLDAYQILSTNDVKDFAEQYSLTPGKTFGFIGGLDAPKRVDFLAEVLDYLWRVDGQIKLVVGGTGELHHLLAPAIQRGQVVMLGYSGSNDKALIMRISQALLNPGRIGLVAVDSLAVGIPILTTDWKFHAPEYDYLAPERDVFESRNSVAEFSQLIIRTSNNEKVWPIHSRKSYPLLNDMINNFARGVQKMFA